VAAGIQDHLLCDGANSTTMTSIAMARTPENQTSAITTLRQSDHDRRLLRELVRGDQEISAGRGYDLDQILDDADRMLTANPR